MSFVEIDHEILSTVIFPFRLIQEGQLSVTDESMCTKYWLMAYSTKPAQEKVSRLTGQRIYIPAPHPPFPV